MGAWIAILIQLALAALAVQQAAVHLLPCVHRLRHPALVLDVWLPVALILPLMFLALGVEGGVRGIGWYPVASPVMIALAAFAAAMLWGEAANRQVGQASGASPPLLLTFAAVLAGLLLLLIGAAHVMTVWIGQSAFVIGAVLLWMNTPHEDAASRDHLPTTAQLRAGWSMLIVLVCAAGQGAAAVLAGPELFRLCGFIMLMTALLIVLAALWRAGASASMRIGLWAGSLGVFFALGSISLTQLVPRLLLALRGEPPPRTDAIAYGFGAYAFEATLLMVIMGLAWLMQSADAGLRRVVGSLAMIALVVFLWLRV